MTDFSEIEAIIANRELEQARAALRPLLESEADNPQVWYLASKAARNEAQRRYFLEQAVQRDPLFHAAANELHSLTMPQTAIAPKLIAVPSSAPVYASASKRLAAFLVDGFILIMINIAILFIVLGYAQNMLMLFLLFGLSPIVSTWLYYGYYYTKAGGRSIGANLFQLRVMRRDGKNLTWRDAFVRNVLGYIASGIAFGAGFTWQFFNPQHQAWHDIFANTIVIEE
jgi:uncharacterized RDD family membrane protein YckC